MYDLSTVRQVTTEDHRRVYEAAKRFCQRHKIPNHSGEDTPEDDVEIHIHGARPHNAAYLEKLWTACFCRALKEPTDKRLTIAYGYICLNVDH